MDSRSANRRETESELPAHLRERLARWTHTAHKHVYDLTAFYKHPQLGESESRPIATGFLRNKIGRLPRSTNPPCGIKHLSPILQTPNTYISRKRHTSPLDVVTLAIHTQRNNFKLLVIPRNPARIRLQEAVIGRNPALLHCRLLIPPAGNEPAANTHPVGLALVRIVHAARLDAVGLRGHVHSSEFVVQPALAADGGVRDAEEVGARLE